MQAFLVVLHSNVHYAKMLCCTTQVVVAFLQDPSLLSILLYAQQKVRPALCQQLLLVAM